MRELRTNTDLDLLLYKNNNPGGKLHLKDFSVAENPNFVEYLRSGWQMSLSVAIDFTASNGKIEDERSLHYPSEYNEY